MALVLGENGSTQDAIRLLERVVALRKSKLGEEHPDTLASTQLLAYMKIRHRLSKLWQRFRS